MRCVGLAISGIVSILLVQRAYAEVPKNAVDFDRSIGFSIPRDVTVYPAIGQDDLVFLIPNGLSIAVTERPRTAVGLIYPSADGAGDLVLRVRPTVDGVPIQEIVSDLQAAYPKLRFAVPGSKQSSFEVGGAGMVTHRLREKAAGDPLAGDVVYSIRLSTLALRGFLLPASYHLALLAFSGDYIVHGFSRDAQGNLAAEDRPFRVSTTIAGFCALSPADVLNAKTGQSGCVHPKYSKKLVLAVQQFLRANGQEVVVDGAFGPDSESAIRRFQKASNLPIDGIPSVELLEFLRPATDSAKPPTH